VNWMGEDASIVSTAFRGQRIGRFEIHSR
jgi:hypothetical protein